ncbi:ankyrin repeat domain-containing protein [Wolbachia endosymbiont (group B) of Athalia cordata]|uniref:ankyrin repeat domain-containing protein n=1 Tax=Wolbachia endosymbiont (group B) of Athalia cordata TaxID=2953986 RepID=UPI002232927E|nr:ankyrin repeat domain-containing protein [Wolbachia endosymbiont (group B) of Athalia cordata]
MLGKENTKGQVIDNQMDYVDDESTIGAKGGLNHEDRSSSEELQRGRSQESPRVTRSSSIGSSSTSTDDEEMFSCISITSDEIVKKATFFVKTFVKEFEEKLSKYFEEAEPDSNIQKISKASASFSSFLNNTIPASPLKLFSVKVNESINHCVTGKRHKKGAKNIFTITTPCYKAEMREILVKAGLEIFHRFEVPFIKVVDINPSFYHRRVKKLAIDAVHRTMNYLLTSEEQDFSVDLITQGVVLGKSKKKGYFTRPGYEVKDEQSGESLVTSELYEWVGIKKKEEDETVNYYQYNSEEHNLEEYNCAEKYGYRLPFEWELRKWEEVKQKYVSSEVPIERYVYILNDEKKEELARFILKEINEQDPVKRKDIEDVKEHLRKQDEDRRQFSYSFGKTPENFIERKEVVKNLNLRLHSSSQEVKMSRVVLISGKSGIGKSELARGYGFSERRKATWARIMWIDASSCTNLSNSFHGLAERLGVSRKSEQRRERNIKSIVEDVYEYLQDTKSLFVFDDASSYKEIENFLPSSFPVFSNREKPYVLITSPNKNWKEEIEDIEEIKLGNLKKEEAEEFTRKALGEDESQGKSISELIEEFNCFPLDLKAATSCIKQKGLSIREYLEEYRVAQQSKPDFLETQVVNKKSFKALKINIDKIKEEKNVGQQAYVILVFMAYLDPNQINTKEIFFKGESKENQQRVLDALDLLNQFSLIGLEKGIAKIHQEVQKIIRLEQRKEKREEEFLRKIMTSLMNNNCKNVSHIISIWNYASEYKKLVNEFIESDYYGMNILHFLAIDDNEEVIKLIFENVDLSKLSRIVNIGDKDGSTPLEYAVIYGHLALVKYFIGKGANFKVSDDPSLTLLDCAALHNRLEIVRYFIDNEHFQFDSTVLYYAIENNCLEVVRYFIEEEEICINLQDGEGKGYLHYAVEHNSLEIFEYLLAYGATVDLQDEDGMTPLHFAAKNGRLSMLKSLIKKKAVIEVPNKDAMTPLHFAAIYGYLGIVRYLVGHGAGINLKDKNGMTPLHFAAMYGYLGIVRYLVEHGADINLQNEDHMTPLYLADVYGHSSTVRYLVMNNVNTNLEDISNNISQNYDVKFHCYDSARSLFSLEQGANVKLELNDDLYHYTNNYYPSSICCYQPQSTVYSAPYLKTQSHKRNLETFDEHTLPKKRKLKNISEALQFEDKSTVNLTHRSPISSFNSVSVQPANKDLRL